MLKYVEKTDERRVPAMRPNDKAMGSDEFFAFVSNRYPKIVKRLAE